MICKKQIHTKLTIHSNITGMLKTFQNFSVTQQIPKGYTRLLEKDLYIRTLLRTLQAGIENNNQLLKNLSWLLRKNLASFMRVSTHFLCHILLFLLSAVANELAFACYNT